MTLAPVITPETPHLINSSYIVMLKPGVDAQSLLMHVDFLKSAHAESPLDASFNGDNGGLKHVYDSPGTKGYAGAFSDLTVERIRAQPEVDYVEQDQTVWAYDLEIQKNAPWVSIAIGSINNILFLGRLTNHVTNLRRDSHASAIERNSAFPR
jgi:cerevisin